MTEHGQRSLRGLLAALLAALTLAGCGGSTQAPAPTPEAAAQEPAQTPEPTATPVPEPEYTQMELGQTLTLGGIELTLCSAETTGAVCAVRGGMGVSRNAPEGKRFLTVTGRVKNLLSREIDAANFSGSMEINGQYVYPMELFVIQELSFRSLVQPLTEARLVLYAALPAELADSVETCVLTFGFEDGLTAMPAGAEQSANPLRLELAADPGAKNPVEVRPFAPEGYELKELIAADFAEITFTDVKVSNRLTKKYRGNTYSIYTEPGMRVLYLEGVIKNTSQGNLVPCITGTVTVNGYEYPLRDWEAMKGTALSPLQEAPIFLYAQVPPELLKGEIACRFCFGFNENFENNEYTALEGCRYVRTLDWER